MNLCTKRISSFRRGLFPFHGDSLCPPYQTFTPLLPHRVVKAWDEGLSSQSYLFSTLTVPRSQGSQPPSPETSTTNPNHIQVQVKDGVRRITINRPEKKNAITIDMFRNIIKAMMEANTDENTVVVAITGVGDHFTSGMDMTPRPKPKEMTEDSGNKTAERKPRSGIGINKFLSCFVECKKPVIALVNGPALGVGVTFLGLVDAVYASDRATFHTNFTKFALPPEMGSTFTFPTSLGYLKASNILMFNQKMTAEEAYRCGLVSRVFPHDNFDSETQAVLQKYGQLPVKSLMYSKELVRGRYKDTIIKVSETEQSYFDPEMAKKVIMQFMARKTQNS